MWSSVFIQISNYEYVSGLTLDPSRWVLTCVLLLSYPVPFPMPFQCMLQNYIKSSRIFNICPTILFLIYKKNIKSLTFLTCIWWVNSFWISFTCIGHFFIKFIQRSLSITSLITIQNRRPRFLISIIINQYYHIIQPLVASTTRRLVLMFIQLFQECCNDDRWTAVMDDEIKEESNRLSKEYAVSKPQNVKLLMKYPLTKCWLSEFCYLLADCWHSWKPVPRREIDSWPGWGSL